MRKMGEVEIRRHLSVDKTRERKKGRNKEGEIVIGRRACEQRKKITIRKKRLWLR